MVRLYPDLTEQVMDDTPWVRVDDNTRRKTPKCVPTKVGEFYWDLSKGERQIVIAIPSGNGYCICGWPITYTLPNGSQWKWDGNEVSPTLTPSLGLDDIWHGWVKGGTLVEA